MPILPIVTTLIGDSKWGMVETKQTFQGPMVGGGVAFDVAATVPTGKTLVSGGWRVDATGARPAITFHQNGPDSNGANLPVTWRMKGTAIVPTTADSAGMFPEFTIVVVAYYQK